MEIFVLQPTAKLIRLVLHDCVTHCDGCLDLNNPDNNGLSEIYQEVNMLYNSQFSLGRNCSSVMVAETVLHLQTQTMTLDSLMLTEVMHMSCKCFEME